MKNKKINIFFREDGFTIQELVVVLIVGSMVVAFSFSLFLFVNKMFHTWNRKTELHDAVDAVVQRMATDIQKSISIIEITDSTLTLEKELGNVIRYRYNSDTLWRNNDPMFSSENISLHTSIQSVVFRYADSSYVPVMNIKVMGKRKDVAYSSSVEVTVPFSSRARFSSIVK